MVTISPITAIIAVVVILFVIWLLFSGGEHNVVGVAPLLPSYQPKPDPILYRVELPPLEPDGTSAEPSDKVDVTPELPEELNIAPLVNPGDKGGEYGSETEKLACEAAARVFGAPFEYVGIRPDWMRNPETGKNLEIDCYSDDLKIGIEYNGPHHYQWPNWTKQSKTQFINQYRRDQAKPDMCDSMGVYLITIPYTVPKSKFDDYIRYYSPEEVYKRSESIEF